MYTSGLYYWFPVLHVIMNLRINTLPMLNKVVPEWRKFVLVSFSDQVEKLSQNPQSGSNSDRQVLHIMICYGGECTVRVKYVPTEQSFSNDSSHCLVIVKNKIKLHLQKTTLCDYLI